MKKLIICMAAVLGMSTAAQAQDGKIRAARYDMEEIQNYMANKARTPKETQEMEKLSVKVRATLEAALENPKTKKEFANAYDMLAMLDMFAFSPYLDQVIAHQETDTTRLAELLYSCLDNKQKAYEAEVALAPKEVLYINKNRTDVLKFRMYVAYLGQMFFQNKQFDKAVDAFDRWMKYPQTYTILDGVDGVANDESTPQIAYFTCLCAYFGKDYDTFDKYSDLARTYTDEKEQVNQLILQCYNDRGLTDRWLAFGKELVKEDPNANEAVMQNLLAYFFENKKTDEAVAFADEILALDPANKLGNYAKGLVLMNDRKYLEAVTYFDKAIEADPNYSDALFNAGVCYSNYGYDINDALSGKKMNQAQYKKETDKVRDEYRKAEPYFVRVQELEPENTTKWASRLATVYYILGDQAKQKEYEKLAGY